ncbi:hypothetical protein [Actinomyces gaoshouyii]|uniref:Uncharacterized protein n=1 Tax=Actinomyces gaoshouyii TaxID=1960083 RepID=A0A8H9HCG1_9ACTO|nr:hypothetical protein [Actinomyces gaoshouyii]ARD41863.1 hypothetical protein B6G06_05525 [Actinomyces gaoshouyii]GGP00012.1 hypothetical protein GCM10011612_18660 [Actinomyces gaoshouyii]
MNDQTTPDGARPDDADRIDDQFAALVEGLDLGGAEGAIGESPESPTAAGGTAGASDGGTVDPAPTGSPAARALKIAVVLTPLPTAEALASLCAMSGLDCVAVPASSGAFAVKEFASAHAEWDIAELLGGSENEPAEAAELAATLSRLSRGGSVLLTADLATDVGIEEGLSGTITARRFAGGRPGEEASAGLILSQMDQIVEDVLLGILRPEDAPGAMLTSEIKAGRAMRWIGRGLRRPGTD